jgi:hypothetical protein
MTPKLKGVVVAQAMESPWGKAVRMAKAIPMDKIVVLPVRVKS